LKVCQNCVHWSGQLKGYCHLTNTGVGKLWRCPKFEVQSAPHHPEEDRTDWKSLPN
jgi:hypothetical protein